MIKHVDRVLKDMKVAEDPGADLIDEWFALRDLMLVEGKTSTGARPPSLREACYAHALAMRGADRTDSTMIESFVNGMELGAMSQLREAWTAWRASALSDHRA